MFAIVKDADGRLLEIAVIRGINVDKLLRIPINQREPAALDLDHEPVAFFKGMGNIRNSPFDCLYLAGSKGDRFFEAFPEATAHDLSVYQHLVAAHGIGRAVVMTAYGHRAFRCIAEIVGEYVDHLDDKIRVGAAEADLEIGDHRTGKREVFGEDGCLER